MSHLLAFLAIALPLISFIQDQRNKKKQKEIEGLQKEFYDLPIEVQQAIHKVRPELKERKQTKKGKSSTRSKKKMAKQRETDFSNQRKEITKTQDHVAFSQESLGVLHEKDTLDENTHPLDFVESYDNLTKAFVYSEILGEPKYKRR